MAFCLATKFRARQFLSFSIAIIGSKASEELKVTALRAQQA